MSTESNVPKVGRPRKNIAEKAKYQHIAVHETDYIAFLEKVEQGGLKKVETFHEMVKQYNPTKKD